MKKWRNKITGEINEFMVHKRIEDSEDGNPVYAPFDGHIDDWEDYEDEDVEEEFWYVDTDCETYGVSRAFNQNNSDDVFFNKSIGNYFETKEEAEKAVEKLKAWKRLKDRGFRFDGYNACSVDYDIDEQYRKYISQDLNLLFGGEE